MADFVIVYMACALAGQGCQPVGVLLQRFDGMEACRAAMPAALQRSRHVGTTAAPLAPTCRSLDELCRAQVSAPASVPDSARRLLHLTTTGAAAAGATAPHTSRLAPYLAILCRPPDEEGGGCSG